MPNHSPYKAALQKLFRIRLVARLEDLRQALKRQSRTTILHALRAVGYLTSYSHAGRYYTLKRIPLSIAMEKGAKTAVVWLLFALPLSLLEGGVLSERPAAVKGAPVLRGEANP